ncbi:MAG: hypothetical protein L0154_20045 [Chloroflexi bacterium]|nr:hypothetical protein [Chloroflexota bacterium]
MEWGELDGWTVPLRSETQWDNDKPWAVWELEQVVLNVDVAARLDTFGIEK